MARLKNKGTALVANGPSHDALEDLLNAIAAVYDVFPDLWLDQELRYAKQSPLEAPIILLIHISGCNVKIWEMRLQVCVVNCSPCNSLKA